MSNRVLMMSDEIRAQISSAIERARQKPIGPQTVKDNAFAGDPRVATLADRKPGFARTEASENVLIPMGYRAAVSVEHQPVGLCLHLSVSVDTPGKLPSVPAVQLIAEAFGIDSGNTMSSWLEEFEPGHFAVNVVALDRKKGPLQ